MRRVSAPDLPSCSPVSPDETLSPGSPRATALPAGVRDVLPVEWKRREHLRQHLFGLLRSWGYEGVDLTRWNWPTPPIRRGTTPSS